MVMGIFFLVFTTCGDDDYDPFETANIEITIKNNSSTAIKAYKIGDGTGDESHNRWYKVNILPGQTSNVLGPHEVRAAYGPFEYQIIVYVWNDDVFQFYHTPHRGWGIWHYSGKNPPPNFIALNYGD
jgi:hypothetical protein